MDGKRCPVNLPLLKEIMAFNFAELETVLYLDTHPNDRRVLELHNSFAKHYNRLVKEYQERYCPLYTNFPEARYPWQWINQPWPWEIEY